jgi:hypothetical protein
MRKAGCNKKANTSDKDLMSDSWGARHRRREYFDSIPTAHILTSFLLLCSNHL